MADIIKSIDPTILVKEIGGFPKRLVRFCVELDGPADCSLAVKGPGIDETISLGTAAAGETSHRCFLPDSRKIGTLDVGLQRGDSIVHSLEVPWTPARHWTIDMIHMSHHDWGYTGIPSDVLREQVDSIDRVLDWCEETESWPEDSKFRYLCEQAWSVVPWMESRPKAQVDRLINYARQGRIEIPAIWGNQITEMCGHEELVRLMYPSARIAREHGIDIVSAVHNDIPGFSWGMVSTLVGGGVKYLAFSMPAGYYGKEFGDDRPEVHSCWDEKEFLSAWMPGAFLWEGPDGKRLLTYYVFNYGRVFPLPWETMEKDIEAECNKFAQMGYPHDIIGHMVSSGWRDNAPPTLRIAELCRAWNAKWEYPKLRTATNKSFMSQLQTRHGNDLKVFRGELPNTDYTVCATCTPKETAVNRRAHETLVTAEKLATVASELAGYKYPDTVIEDAYRSTFTYNLHCWGMYSSGGAAMDASWDEKRAAATRTEALAEDVIIKAANRITDQIAYAEKGYHLTVFNQLSRRRDSIVRMPASDWGPATLPMCHMGPGEIITAGSADGRERVVIDPGIFEKGFDLIDLSTEKSVPYQVSVISDPSDPRPWAAEFVARGRRQNTPAREIVFTAEDLPAFGYRTYRLVPHEAGPDKSGPGESRENTSAGFSADTIENRFFALKIDAQTGGITSIIDRESGEELVDAEAPHGFGNLVVRRCGDASLGESELRGIEVIEQGEIFIAVRIKGATLGVPRWTKDIVLYHKTKRIDVCSRLLRDSEPNIEIFHAFPFLMKEPRFRFEASGSVVEPLKDQIPGSNTNYYAMQHWAQVSDAKTSIAWSPVDNHLAEFGGMWPGYVSGAHHGVTAPGYGDPFLKPGEITKGHIYSLVMYNNYQTNFINVQPSEFMCRYSFTSFPREANAGQDPANARDFGWDVTNPPVGVWMEGPTGGRLPAEDSFCEVDAENIVVLSLKRAEDEDGIIVRVMETEGKDTSAEISIPWLDFSSAVETDLVENDAGSLPSGNHAVRLQIGPYAMKTLRLRK